MFQIETNESNDYATLDKQMVQQVNSIESGCRSSLYRSKIIFAIGLVVIVVLAIFVGLLGGGIIPSLSSKVSQKANLGIKQVVEGNTDENSISGHFVHNREGSLICWISYAMNGDNYLNFARCESNTVLMVPEMRLSVSYQISYVSLSDTELKCAVCDSTQVVNIYQWSLKKQSWNLFKSLAMTFSKFGQSIIFDSQGDLIVTSLGGVHCYSEKFEIVFTETVKTVSDLFGHQMDVQNKILCIPDPSLNQVTIFRKNDKNQYIVKYSVHSHSTERKSFGSQVALSVNADKLFVSYSSMEEVVEYYKIASDGNFLHIQSIFNSVLTKNVSFAHFGYSIACNENYMAISSPSEENDSFSNIQIFHFDPNGQVNLQPQQISIDVPFLGKSMFLVPMNSKSSKIWSTLTLITTNAHASSFGQLLVFQNLKQ